MEISWRDVQGVGWMRQLLHREILQLKLGDSRMTLSRVVHQGQDSALSYVTGKNNDFHGLHFVYLLAEEVGVDSFTLFKDFTVHWFFWTEEETASLSYHELAAS